MFVASTPIPRDKRYCTYGRKIGRSCASGPPWTSSAKGDGSSPSGRYNHAGISRPSKLGRAETEGGQPGGAALRQRKRVTRCGVDDEDLRRADRLVPDDREP